MKKQLSFKVVACRTLVAIGSLFFAQSLLADFKDTSNMIHRFLMDQIGEDNTIADTAPGGGGMLLL